MAANENANEQNEFFNPEKPSVLKQAFQWAGAFAAVLSCEAPQTGYAHFGFTWDYAKAAVGSCGGPKS
jgi:hypothetical protein